MARNNLLAMSLILIAAIFIAGCASQATDNTITTTTSESEIQVSTISTDIVEITTSPAEASTGSDFQISWVVRGNTTADSTRIYYGKSHTDNPSTLSYQSSTPRQCVDTGCKLNYFTSAQISIAEPGTYYFRAYAVIDGKAYWSQERIIFITPPIVPVAREFTLDADDNGFYVSNTSSILSSMEANRNDIIRLIINAKNTGLYKGALEFSGCGQAGTASAGESVTLEFTPTVSCSINSYWPGTGTLKQSLSVIVV